ncbi:MAG: RNA-guided endonuclease TnpB family protein [bacterium]|nr:RNA-guided endonuclease TnpB family protein [bacterium]
MSYKSGKTNKVMHGFLTKIKPNNKQRTMFEKHCGTSRHAWNWGLELCIEKLKNKEKLPSAIDLHKLLVKDVKPKNEWYYESSKCSPQQALRNLRDAFSKYWKERKKNIKLPFAERYHKKFLKQLKEGKLKSLSIWHEKGFPQFKKKGLKDSFYLEGNIQIKGNKIKIPIIGWIKIYENIPFDKSKNVTISRRGECWFISFKTDITKTIDTTKRKGKSGADLGIKTLCTLSDGKTFPNPKPYNKNKKKLKRLQRKLSRQYEACKNNKDKNGRIIYSNNYKKTKAKIEKVHLKISNIRKDSTHKLTNYLVKNHDQNVIEDLNVSGMMKNHNLASSIADGGFFEFKCQMIYKSEWYGSKLIIADRWFASSKTCSCCGHKQNMPLRQRTFNCEKCKLSIDRDLNAAINLMNYNAPSKGVKACGDAKFHSERKVSVNEAGIRHQTTAG